MVGVCFSPNGVIVETDFIDVPENHEKKQKKIIVQQGVRIHLFFLCKIFTKERW